MPRYADEFILLCQSETEAQEALAEVRPWVDCTRSKTRIVNTAVGESFESLGWHFERGYKWPREKSQQKFKETIRQRTKRRNGQPLPKIITGLNRVIRGWGKYFQGEYATCRRSWRSGCVCASAASCAGGMADEAEAAEWITTVTQMPG